MTTSIDNNITTTAKPLPTKKNTEVPFAPKESEEQEQATSMAIFFILLVVGKSSINFFNITFKKINYFLHRLHHQSWEVF